jgi:hypothetical protein
MNNYFHILSKNKKIIVYENERIKHSNNNIIIYNSKDTLHNILLNIDTIMKKERIGYQSIHSIFSNIQYHYIYIDVNNHNYFEKIDKYNTKYNSLIKNIFSKNTIHKNYIYTFLTHYNIWKILKTNNIYDYFIIIDNNALNVKNRIDKDVDILLFKNTFTYIIHKKCFNKIFEYIHSNKIQDANIYNFFLKLDSFKIVETDHEHMNKPINELMNQEFNEDIFNKYEYMYIKNLDHYGDDIVFANTQDINNIKYYLEENDSCIAFNTYGYIKHSVDMNNLITLNNEKYGLYIHIDRYNKKYNSDLLKNIISNEILFSLKIINNYLFIKSFDYSENNIYVNNNYTINEMIDYANKHKNIVAFNTLGNFKNKVEIQDLQERKIMDNSFGIFIKIDAITDDNKYLKINNIDTMDTEYIYNEKDKDDYIAYNSNNMYKKDIHLDNIIHIPSIYNNYLCINLKKYVDKLK